MVIEAERLSGGTGGANEAGDAAEQRKRVSHSAYVITPISNEIRSVPYRQMPSSRSCNSVHARTCKLVMPRVTFIVGYTRLVIPSIRSLRAVFFQYRTKSVTSGPTSTEEISLARRWLAKFDP